MLACFFHICTILDQFFKISVKIFPYDYPFKDANSVKKSYILRRPHGGNIPQNFSTVLMNNSIGIERQILRSVGNQIP